MGDIGLLQRGQQAAQDRIRPERSCHMCPVGGWTLERQECISERVNSAARAPAPRCLPRSLHFYADWKLALCVLLKLNVRLLILLLVSNEI